MHRHDTYGIGHTPSGVQSFKYRRGSTHSRPGHTMVLHPDEAHDGQAGTGEGFQYRMIYVQPAPFQGVLGGCVPSKDVYRHPKSLQQQNGIECKDHDGSNNSGAGNPSTIGELPHDIAA